MECAGAGTWEYLTVCGALCGALAAAGSMMSSTDFSDNLSDELDSQSDISADEALDDAQNLPTEPGHSRTTLALASGQQFPEDVTQILESYYARGMRGWGKQHTAEIMSASKATGLKQAQIEVRV